jgi:hypothetical protein
MLWGFMVRRYPTVPLIKINLEYRKLSPVVGIQINSISPARELSMVFFFCDWNANKYLSCVNFLWFGDMNI